MILNTFAVVVSCITTQCREIMSVDLAIIPKICTREGNRGKTLVNNPILAIPFYDILEKTFR